MFIIQPATRNVWRLLKKVLMPAFSIQEKREKSSSTGGNLPLRSGCFSLGIGLGIIAGAILESAAVFPSEEAGYFSMIFIFGGLALVLFYLIDRKSK